MYDLTPQAIEPALLEEANLLVELDRLVDMAWQPGWAPMMLGELIRLCAWLRDSRDAEGWALSKATLRAHPIHRLMQEDPLVQQAGEPHAVWLDLLLGQPVAAPLLAGTSRAGQDLFATTRALAWPSALRTGIGFLARMVDAVAAEVPGARILTIGAGHLREAALVTGLATLEDWTVIEPDDGRRQSLYRDMPGQLTLRTLRCSLKTFARQPYRRGCFDLICLPGAGLSQALVESAFRVLKPGGRLLICAPGNAPPEAAWMEVFLGMTPIWSRARDMEALASTVRPADCSLRQIFTSVDGHMAYAILRRQG
jgi:SAM-dependent methyltransferase